MITSDSRQALDRKDRIGVMNTMGLEIQQREFFNILDEFFTRATGVKYFEFAPIDEFSTAIKHASKVATQQGEQAFKWFFERIQQFYGRNSIQMFGDSKSIGGMKLLLGGTRFTITHFDAVRKMLLYTDTILIPDPIMPWIETERSEEKFYHILLLQNVFTLLHLKPIVDANLPYPAIVVFPSFEKYLEENDEQTKQGISALVTDFASFHLGEDFGSTEGLVECATANPTRFLTRIEEKKLFVAPGGSIGEPLTTALQKYRDDIKTWRSTDYNSQIDAVPETIFLLSGLFERLGLQYHVMENADELNSQPMFCVNAQWHYYQLCADMYGDRLAANKLLEPTTRETLRALNEPRLQWLGNVPIESLVTLRENNENEDFRQKIDQFTKLLHDASLGDLNQVAAEVGRRIASLLSTHQKKITEIEDKYYLLHQQTAVGAWITLAATIVPSLAPVFGSVAPLVVAAKYGYDKSNEMSERKKAARSLTGILAAAKAGE